MSVWHVRPSDAGQIVEVAWCAIGALGCIRRVVDRSENPPRPSYTLFGWHDDDRHPYEPWNGLIGVRYDTARHLTVEGAERLLMGEPAELRAKLAEEYGRALAVANAHNASVAAHAAAVAAAYAAWPVVE